MHIWLLVPFLLALLAWSVATRRHPEDKERWTWMALGVCAGAVMMFTIAFISESKDIRPTVNSSTSDPPPADPESKKPDNHFTNGYSEVVQIREDRSVTFGLLQITLVDVVRKTAMLQIEPFIDVGHCGGRIWTYSSPVDGNKQSDVPSDERVMSRRTAVELTLG